MAKEGKKKAVSTKKKGKKKIARPVLVEDDADNYSIASLVQNARKKVDEESKLEQALRAQNEKEAAEVEAAIAATEQMKHEALHLSGTLSEEAQKIIKSPRKKASGADDDDEDSEEEDDDDDDEPDELDRALDYILFDTPKNDRRPERGSADDDTLESSERLVADKLPDNDLDSERVSSVQPKSPAKKKQAASGGRTKKTTARRKVSIKASNKDAPSSEGASNGNRKSSGSLLTGQLVTPTKEADALTNYDDGENDELEEWSHENLVVRKSPSSPGTNSLNEVDAIKREDWDDDNHDNEPGSFSNHVDSLDDVQENEVPWQAAPDYLANVKQQPDEDLGPISQQPMYNDNYDYAADQYEVSREADAMQLEEHRPFPDYDVEQNEQHRKFDDNNFDNQERDPDEPVAVSSQRRRKKKPLQPMEERLLKCVTVLLLLVVAALGVAFIVVLVQSLQSDNDSVAPVPAAATPKAPAAAAVSPPMSSSSSSAPVLEPPTASVPPPTPSSTIQAPSLRPTVATASVPVATSLAPMEPTFGVTVPSSSAAPVAATVSAAPVAAQTTLSPTIAPAATVATPVTIAPTADFGISAPPAGTAAPSASGGSVVIGAPPPTPTTATNATSAPVTAPSVPTASVTPVPVAVVSIPDGSNPTQAPTADSIALPTTVVGPAPTSDSVALPTTIVTAPAPSATATTATPIPDTVALPTTTVAAPPSTATNSNSLAPTLGTIALPGVTAEPTVASVVLS